MKSYFIYILTNSGNTVLYIGVTNNLLRRVYEHRKGYVKGFTERYKVKKLVYFEEFNHPREAITREKQLKNWHREWKLNLIRSINPTYSDLYNQILK